jgi:hypothetical protein
VYYSPFLDSKPWQIAWKYQYIYFKGSPLLVIL